MADGAPLTPEQLARQAKQHLESLRAAGVEWLPGAPPPAVTPAAVSPPKETRAAPPTSLPVLTEPAPVQRTLLGGAEAPTAEGSLTLEQRKEALAALAQRVAQCLRCPELVSTRTQTVFGVGALDAELCFVGEAPGADEDRLGEPFVGRAGQLLNRIIAACGMKREDVYICNILRCLHGFTKVLTEDGWQQIQRIVARQYVGRVAAVDEAGRLTWAKITGHHRTPRAERKLVKLCLHSSRQGRRPAGGVFTEDHEVLTRDGYKRIRDLNAETDRIHSGTYQPGPEVRQALAGMLLGDARFSRNTNSLSITHGLEQTDYLRHKAKLLGVPEGRIRLLATRHGRTGRIDRRLTFHCRATPFFRRLGKQFYPDGRKTITPSCLDEFGPIALAYLFMDDGYLRIRPPRSPRAEIATCCFTEEEVARLIEKIGELGIRGYTRPNSRYNRIYFDVENTARLSRLIAPFVLESMNYKLIAADRDIAKRPLRCEAEPFYDTFTVQPAAPVYARCCKTVYCLSVEKYENFLTLSGVVHNCRPPDNRTPRPDEAANCREYLEQTLDLVRPKFICCLGACAAQNLLGTQLSVGKLRARFHDYRGITVMVTYHPSYLLRYEPAKKDVWEDMKKLLARMGKPVPGTKK